MASSSRSGSTQITKAQIEALRRRATAALSKAKNAKKDVEEATERVVQSMEVGASAFGFGLVGGRYGGFEILGLPGDLAAAIGLHATAVMVDEGAEHLHNFGDGALAAYLHTLGLGIGRKWQQDAVTSQLPPPQVPAAPNQG